MAANSRLSKMSMGDEQYTFCWKFFTSWDFVISNAETAKNKYAATATVFKVRMDFLKDFRSFMKVPTCLVPGYESQEGSIKIQ
jgi:hypothetical protein